MEPVQTDAAPKAIGPYSQAIKANGMVFVSGQIPVDPATGELLADRPAAVQAQRVLTNLQAVLAAAGTDMAHVVRTTVFLKDMADFAAVNEVYASFFPGVAPARACIQVARLPKDVSVEIDCIAILP